MLVVFTVTTTHFTSAAVLPRFTGLVAEGSFVAQVAQTLASGRVTAAVFEVTVTMPITAGPPPACHTLTHTSPLVAR